MVIIIFPPAQVVRDRPGGGVFVYILLVSSGCFHVRHREPPVLWHGVSLYICLFVRATHLCQHDCIRPCCVSS